MERNIGVIGCGYWGKNLVRNFHELGALHYICDIDESQINSLREKYPDVEISLNCEDLLTDPRVKAVAIATPAASHFILAREALLADKDVFVEKPLALNYKDGENLVSLAREKKRILMVGHVLEYHPAIIKLKELVDKGELGNIKYIYSNRLNLGKFRTEENILWSFAPHDISIILGLLGEMPTEVTAHGANYLEPDKADVTITNMAFPSGVRAHIFVSWLHPYKEQKLIVIGGKKMALFDNVNSQGKLYLYNHKIDWVDRIPVPRPENAQILELEDEEPLKRECKHFLDCLMTRRVPKTDGMSGLSVLKILEACQESLRENGRIVPFKKKKKNSYFVHKTSVVDENVEIGEETRIWHFSHILKNTRIGKDCNIGQNVMIGPNVIIGNNVKIQNNVSIYDGVILEDHVFCGPSMVFTNVLNPRSHWPRRDEYKKTLVKKGASLGANSTIICGITIGQYAFVGAGAAVSKDVPDYALVYGVPAQIKGWMCYCGEKLDLRDDSTGHEFTECRKCMRKYEKKDLAVREMAHL
jgi:UDP-2-acetamido-3-amino-2,3-dideoxy-glucuronate N-acetyltransferase